VDNDERQVVRLLSVLRAVRNLEQPSLIPVGTPVDWARAAVVTSEMIANDFNISKERMDELFTVDDDGGG